jgi:hypothetical protein
MLFYQRARLVELTGVLQEIRKGLAMEKDRTRAAQLESSVQDYAVIEPDHVESEVRSDMLFVMAVTAS